MQIQNKIVEEKKYTFYKFKSNLVSTESISAKMYKKNNKKKMSNKSKEKYKTKQNEKLMQMFKN